MDNGVPFYIRPEDMDLDDWDCELNEGCWADDRVPEDRRCAKELKDGAETGAEFCVPLEACLGVDYFTPDHSVITMNCRIGRRTNDLTDEEYLYDWLDNGGDAAQMWATL